MEKIEKVEEIKEVEIEEIIDEKIEDIEKDEGRKVDINEDIVVSERTIRETISDL